jgi:hypothetical protein
MYRGLVTQGVAYLGGKEGEAAPGDLSSIPRLCTRLLYFATDSQDLRWDPCVRSACGTCASGPPWDPHVRSGRGTCPVRLRDPPVSHGTDARDPRVRSDRRVGPACQVRPDLRGSSDRTRVGPACQVRPTRGTRMSGRTHVGPACQVGPAWQFGPDLRVRFDRRVGPACQDGLTGGSHM